MIITSIPYVIELGMALDFDDNFPEYLEIKNSSGSFKYLQGIFYSGGEEIGYRQYSTEKSCWEMFIYGKTSRYGAFFNYTVSKHIGYLINYVKQHYHYKTNWKLVDVENQLITGRKSWGKKFSNHTYECPICLEEKEKGKILICGHRFCKECINKWLKDHASCPYCKTPQYEKD